jgi:hypothetical protein
MAAAEAGAAALEPSGVAPEFVVETSIINGPLNSLFNFSITFSASSALVNFSLSNFWKLLF